MKSNINSYKKVAFFFTIPLICFLFLHLLSVNATAVVIEVKPGGSIQKAIDTAFAGRDEILVYDDNGKPYTYYENIDFKGKPVAVRSKNGPLTTIIDGGHNGSVVVFNSGGTKLVLEGFTIQNGLANADTNYYGGGIYCSGAAPIIKNCIVKNNKAPETGGGIYCYLYKTQIIDCVIISNEAVDSGGGIYCNTASPDIINSVIGQKGLGNKVTRGGGKGGGIFCFNSALVIKNSTISHNEATSGAGMHSDKAYPKIIDSVISENMAFFPNGGGNDRGLGGGITFEFSMYNSTLRPQITNSVFYKNAATHDGGAIYSVNSSPIITNCTMYGNTAGAFGSGIYAHFGKSSIKVTNTIIWGNGSQINISPWGDSQLGISNFENSVDINYSNIKGNIDTFPGVNKGGVGNIESDPKFVDTATYRLYVNSDSPCIDKGDPNSATPDFPGEDIEKIFRPQSLMYDMGAYEYCENRNTYYMDGDGDGFGDLAKSQTVCSANPPLNYVTDSSDCDDSEDSVYPGAQEICNLADDNCNGVINEGFTTFEYYRDDDGDGFGDPSYLKVVCDQTPPPVGYVSNNNDCDDTNASINTAAIEVCNGKDDNCDGEIDEGFSTEIYYQDSDGDGFGSEKSSIDVCTGETPPTGYVVDKDDCDDFSAAINPNTVWYQDSDGDGFGSSTSLTQCLQPEKYVLDKDDCDDKNPILNPDTVWYKDVDEDGYSDGSTINACQRPADYKLELELISLEDDCDDSDANINPSSGSTIWYKDEDNDGYSDGLSMSQCEQPDNYKLPADLIDVNGDCDDTNYKLNPGTKWYKDMDGDLYSDGIVLVKCLGDFGYKLAYDLIATSGDDDDNDPLIFPSSTNTWYRDGDDDGYSNGSTVTQLTKPDGYKTASNLIARTGDCEDNDPLFYPGAPENCDDMLDRNCDGQSPVCEDVLIKLEPVIFDDISKPLAIMATVVDTNSTVASVVLYYKAIGVPGGFAPKSMYASGGLWNIIFLPKEFPENGMEYYILASNSKGDILASTIDSKILPPAPKVPSVNALGLVVLFSFVLTLFFKRFKAA